MNAALPPNPKALFEEGKVSSPSIKSTPKKRLWDEVDYTPESELPEEDHN